MPPVFTLKSVLKDKAFYRSYGLPVPGVWIGLAPNDDMFSTVRSYYDQPAPWFYTCGVPHLARTEVRSISCDPLVSANESTFNHLENALNYLSNYSWDSHLRLLCAILCGFALLLLSFVETVAQTYKDVKNAKLF